MALPRLLPDGKPLPPARRDAPSEALRGNAASERGVLASVQSSPPPRGPCPPRTLSRALGREGAAPPGTHPLRRPEPRARRAVSRSCRVAVEQPPGRLRFERPSTVSDQRVDP